MTISFLLFHVLPALQCLPQGYSSICLTLTTLLTMALFTIVNISLIVQRAPILRPLLPLPKLVHSNVDYLREYPLSVFKGACHAMIPILFTHIKIITKVQSRANGSAVNCTHILHYNLITLCSSLLQFVSLLVYQHNVYL